MRLTALSLLAVFPLTLLSTVAECQQPPATGSVHGMAKLLDTREPAVGTTVTLSPLTAKQVPPIPASGEYVVRDQADRTLYATVDSAGAFRIDSVPPGEYSLRAYKPGYIDQDASQSDETGDVRTRELHVLSGESTNADIQLERGGSIEGKVLFSDGRPTHTGEQVAAEVAINVERETAPGKFSRSGGAAHTDADGHYRIEGLPAGRYIVFAALPGGMVSTARGLIGASGQLIFAPGTVRASKADVVAVSGPDTRSEANIEIATEGLHTLSGRLVDPTGVPVTEGLLRLFPTGKSELSRSAPPGKNGEFAFADLPQEEYTLSFESYGAIQFLGITEDKTGVRMLRQKAPFSPASVQVHVSDQDPPPIVLTVKPAR